MFEKVKKFLEELKEENIKFKTHFYESTIDRPVTEEFVRKHLKKTRRLFRIERQQSKRDDEEKYKIWIRLSNRYALVVVMAIYKKNLYIITSWNINIKWQK